MFIQRPLRYIDHRIDKYFKLGGALILSMALASLFNDFLCYSTEVKITT